VWIGTAGALLAIIAFGIWLETDHINKRRSGVIAPSANATGTVVERAVAPFSSTQAISLQQSWAEHLGVPFRRINSAGLTLLLIPPGEFTMGDTPAQITRLFNQAKMDQYPRALLDRVADSQPAHRVKITRPFYLSSCKVTVEQFERFVAETGYRTEAEKDGLGGLLWNPDNRRWTTTKGLTWRDPGFRQESNCPVVMVSWFDASNYCRWLSGHDGVVYRLPTEAEWEYACRAGTTSCWYTGEDRQELRRAGNLADAALKAEFPNSAVMPWNDSFAFTAPVASFQPNPFGLFDMYGNAFEWCSDWYDPKYYERAPEEDPQGPSTGKARVIRGGAWSLTAEFCRSGDLSGSDAPGTRTVYNGFRPVSELSEKSVSSIATVLSSQTSHAKQSTITEVASIQATSSRRRPERETMVAKRPRTATCPGGTGRSRATGTAMRAPRLWAPSNLTHMGCTIWAATSGNGAATGTARK
jgi:formylglycine-generating enzyme required for sulfatase activity